MELNPPYLLFLGDCRDPFEAKTAFGLYHWRRELCVGRLSLADCQVELDLPELSIQAAVAQGARSLVVGLATHGGVLRPHWHDTLIAAAEAGMEIVSGLHERLTNIPALVATAERHGVRLLDIRHPDAERKLTVAKGGVRPGKRLLTVGTDGYVGKKYTALAIEREMKQRGFNADFRATGQTGIMIAGRGIPYDAIPGDFLCGSVEWLAPANDPDHWDVIEGQGCLLSPVASSLLGLINGAQPDLMVICHEPTRPHIRGLPGVPLPGIREVMEINLFFAHRHRPDSRFIGISINTSGLPTDEGDDLLAALSAEFGLPAVDPIRTGVAALVDQIPGP